MDMENVEKFKNILSEMSVNGKLKEALKKATSTKKETKPVQSIDRIKLLEIFKKKQHEQAKLMCLTYDQQVSFLIREKYSQDEEFAILRQRDTKPEEFEEYNKYCEECKNKVKKGEF